MYQKQIYYENCQIKNYDTNIEKALRDIYKSTNIL